MFRIKGSKQSYAMVTLVLEEGVLFFSGGAGGAVFLLWLLACTGMRIAMISGMRGMSNRRQHTHPDSNTMS